jgi:hypothetical protein
VKASYDSKGKYYTKCVDLLGGTVKEGTPIGIWGCDHTDTNQQWTFDTASDAIQLKSNPKWCIDAGAGGKAGTKLKLWQCNKLPAQKWNGGGAYQFISGGDTTITSSSNCMDIPNGKLDKSTPIQIWGCYSTDPAPPVPTPPAPAPPSPPAPSPGGNNQMWLGPSAATQGTVLYMGSCVPKCETVASCKKSTCSKCLDLSGGSTKETTLLQIWDCNGKDSQKWKLVGENKKIDSKNNYLQYDGGSRRLASTVPVGDDDENYGKMCAVVSGGDASHPQAAMKKGNKVCHM